MYIDSGKDLKVDKIVSPRPDKPGAGANMRTQVPVKQSTKLETSQVAMKTAGAVTANGEKYA